MGIPRAHASLTTGLTTDPLEAAKNAMASAPHLGHHAAAWRV